MGVVNLSGSRGRKKLHLKMGCSSGATRGLWLTLISLLVSALGSSSVASRKRESTGDVWVDRGCGVSVMTQEAGVCRGVSGPLTPRGSS